MLHLRLPKVPISDIIRIIDDLLHQDYKSLNLFELIFNYFSSTYFIFQDKFSEQTSGCSICPPLCLVDTNIVMETFQIV